MLEGECTKAQFLFSSNHRYFDLSFLSIGMAWDRHSLVSLLLTAFVSRYTIFWVLLLVSKLAFSYYVEVLL